MWASGVKASVGGAVGFASRIKVWIDGWQSIANSAWTKVEFEDVQYDGLSEWDAVTNHRFTAAADGYYHVAASVNAYLLDAGEVISIRLVKDGAFAYPLAPIPSSNEIIPGADTPVSLTTTVYLEAGEYLELEAWQNSGGSLSISGIPCIMTIDRLA